MDTNISNTQLCGLVRLLREERASCVVRCGDMIRIFRRRGVKDLYELLESEPGALRGALVADKVVGKGAAALMVLGGVAALHAEVVSEPAMALLRGAGVQVGFGECVPNIINRAGNGVCPVETLCAECRTAGECLPEIRKFITENP